MAILDTQATEAQSSQAARNLPGTQWTGGQPLASAMPSGMKAIRVLLADDSEVVRTSLAHLLGMQPDIEVIGQAADGLEAIHLADRLRPDVLVMDVTMPNLSGVQAARYLRQALPQVRVIGLSMHAEEEVGLAMVAAGAAAYVTKSSSPRTLVSAIRRRAGTPTGPREAMPRL